MMGACAHFIVAVTVMLSALHVATPFEDAKFWLKNGQDRLEYMLRQKNNVNRARNVILFIGDGMGINSITGARIFQGQEQGGQGEENVLSFERFPSLGLAKTYNVDKQVPDSAGTATAILTGVKANYGTIGLEATAAYNSCDPIGDPSRRLSGLAEWAQSAGKATGVVTTTRITHATPAAVYAHTNHRDWECDGAIPIAHRSCIKDIARQLAEDSPGKNLRVVLGGGQKQMGVVNTQDEENSCDRSDGKNLVDEWMKGKKNALYVDSRDSLMSANLANVDFLIGLFSPGHMPYVSERGQNHPSLVNMTTQAIRLLQKNKEGYFLLVEAGRIDHAHHGNMPKLAFQETSELDEAVASALKITNPDDTLIIVTADHSHSFTINGYPKRGNDILGLANKPIETPYETITYANGPGYLYHRLNDSSINDTWRPVPTADHSSGRYRHLASRYFKDETHAGEDVAVFASGPFAHLLSGVFEQNYIAHVAAYAAKIGPFHFNKYSPNNSNDHPALKPSALLLFVITSLGFYLNA